MHLAIGEALMWRIVTAGRILASSMPVAPSHTASTPAAAAAAAAQGGGHAASAAAAQV